MADGTRQDTDLNQGNPHPGTYFTPQGDPRHNPPPAVQQQLGSQQPTPRHRALQPGWSQPHAPATLDRPVIQRARVQRPATQPVAQPTQQQPPVQQPDASWERPEAQTSPPARTMTPQNRRVG